MCGSTLLAELRPRAEGPVTLVFGSFAYRDTVLAWIDSARRAAYEHFRIVCMDEDLRRFLHRHGAGGHALDCYELLPDVPRRNFDAITKQRARHDVLGLLRVKLFLHLAANGCDFIHSDADAFWLHDPRPWLMSHPGFDLLCSQGTTHPDTHFHRHRFVLCAGFFLCRANERTRAYFEQVDRLWKLHGGDQFRMNTVLLRDSEARWSIKRPIPAFRLGATWFAPPPTKSLLGCARTVSRLLRALAGHALQRARILWILTSREIIHGRFTGGLTIGVIPMHIVTRFRFEGWDDPLVSHDPANRSG